MTDPSGSGASGSTPRAIASLAKKQNDVTRLGAHKLKFVPTLPTRRKKEDVKKEDVAAPPPSADRGRGRGDRGRGRGRGRGGEGRGAAPRPQVEMTASGPFAMGPAMAGTSARRTAPRSNFTPIVPQGLAGSTKLGQGLTQTKAPTLKKEELDEDNEEVYSDPDEGVEIVDMDNIKLMDFMAPESLARERAAGKKKKGPKVKRADAHVDRKGKGVAKDEPMEVEEKGTPEVNMANAVDLSESEEEEELEDIIDDFALAHDMNDDTNIRQERLYFFQFPTPFPTFVSASTEPPDSGMADDTHEEDGGKKVTFADDTKPPAPSAPGTPGPSARAKTEKEKEPEKEKEKEEPKVDGVIGQLEVYQSGAVKMRLGNGIVMDVTAATQPSFLQQAVYLDPTNKRLCVLGEVNRRFVVSPDIETLLTSMEIAEQPVTFDLGEDLISMDTT
ncbi:hypothetical protein SCP_0904520 [Sparassis crispa]|uniref:DNA-directed RNA polymerase III subunit RPC4 n=1 Tax=Sparassis crispa TaxID=139825 RepID=A0A401GWL7_9APHY|nr:hypothetical protein SCP_0904520 [Sparassis crispa]GBE86573.1 hypothetical protein SCP_0904520 [Sparassis crispa]